MTPPRPTACGWGGRARGIVRGWWDGIIGVKPAVTEPLAQRAYSYIGFDSFFGQYSLTGLSKSLWGLSLNAL